MAREKILVVDDEQDVLELVRYNLEREGFRVDTAASGEEALRKAAAKPPDLIVLDLMLPGIDGLDVCHELKASGKTSHIPLVMLTAKGEESDIVAGLELGADDYVTKPFSPKVLTARIRRLLKRTARREGAEAVIKVHDITIDPSRHAVLAGKKPVPLTLTEFKILRAMARRPGRVFTRYQIMDSVHGDEYVVTDRAVDVQIVSLRRKLGSFGKLIETVRGVGYRFREVP
jgi:two-component system phosphate regulon response regulator PhoB